MGNEKKIDMAFKPTSYWPESLDMDTLLSRIKGKARRDMARRILEEEGFPGLTEFVARENLDDVDREMWGRIHPQLMGGEYLPNLSEGEVEIVRISLKSTTGDQISIRARKTGSKITYRVVDEYETDFNLHFQESDEPLSLEELITFLDRTVHPDDERPGGLIQSHWNFLYDQDRLIEEAVDFVSLESAFYPELVAYYAKVADEWMEKRNREYEEECESREPDIPSPGSVEIGPQLLDLLESWANGGLGWDAARNMSFLAHALKGRGPKVLQYLEEEDTIRAKGVLEKIKSTANGHFHRNPMAAMYNSPLRIVKQEVLGESE